MHKKALLLLAAKGQAYFGEKLSAHLSRKKHGVN
jgi:hypothetical protein